MLNSEVTFKAKNFKPDAAGAEVILGVTKHIVSIQKRTHDVDPWRGL